MDPHATRDVDQEHGAFAQDEPPSTELRGPGSELEAVVRRASPARLVLRLLLGAVLLGGLGAGGWYAREAWIERKAREVRMVRIGAATVTIGNDAGPEIERPAHQVTLAPFDIDLTEVTVAAYAACVKRGRCTPAIKGEFCNWGKDDVGDHPINCVNHAQATAYCAWVGKRLPTEKEWEHAARGSDGRRFPWGADKPGPTRANVCGSECRLFGAHRNRAWNAMHDYDDGWPLTAPVSSFPDGHSALGVADMGGNVREWTSSPFCAYPDDACGNALEFVIRGGGWTTHYPSNLEVTTRDGISRSDAAEALGFRCAR